jgi:hypothetical protein
MKQKDYQLERNHLMKEVYDDLREWCLETCQKDLIVKYLIVFSQYIFIKSH